MRQINKNKILEIWKILEKDIRGYYKPSEITDRQQDLICYMMKSLSRREASVLINLLKVITERDTKEITERDLL